MKSKIAGCTHYESKVVKAGTGGMIPKPRMRADQTFTDVAAKTDREDLQTVNRAAKTDREYPQAVNRADKTDREDLQTINRAAKVDLPAPARAAAPKPRMRPEPAAAPKPKTNANDDFQKAVRRNTVDVYLKAKLKPKKSLFGKNLFGKG